MKKKSLVILFFFAWIFIPNIHAQVDYATQGGELYQPAIGSNMPAQQSSFQSSSYYNNTYTVPFAAESMEIGSSNPYNDNSSNDPTKVSGRKNGWGWTEGGQENQPEGPTIPLGDGMWFLLICALGAVLRITFKRIEKANIQ